MCIHVYVYIHIYLYIHIRHIIHPHKTCSSQRMCLQLASQLKHLWSPGNLSARETPHMAGFHSHGGIPKWMVYHGKSHQNG